MSARITKTGLREEIDAGIEGARAKAKRSKSPMTKKYQKGRHDAFQEIREIFLDGPLP